MVPRRWEGEVREYRELSPARAGGKDGGGVEQKGKIDLSEVGND